VLRPETYRRVVQLLAEPREHVSYREICRQCHVTDDTVKGIEQREAIPIAARKQALMEQAARIARLAADRVEDQIDSATLPQAVVAFGVMTDKVRARADDPALIIRHEHQHLHAHAHRFEPITRDRFDEIIARLEAQEQASQSTLSTPIAPFSFLQEQDTAQEATEHAQVPVQAQEQLESAQNCSGMHSQPQPESDKKAAPGIRA